MDPVLVRLKADIRPTEERGTRKFLEKSYIGGNAFREPTDVSLLRILARDLVVSGAVRDASFVPQEQPYLLDVVITHLAASYGEDLGSLTVVLPTSAIRGVCAVRLQLRDRSGRTFLDEVFEHEERRGGALVAGLEVEAARALAVAVRAAVDAALPRIRASVDAFWARYR